jgi:hypothetical protein
VGAYRLIKRNITGNIKGYDTHCSSTGVAHHGNADAQSGRHDTKDKKTCRGTADAENIEDKS